MKQPPLAIGGLILAAGYSGRAGKFKPLLPYREYPFLLHIIFKLSTFCEEIGIVTGYRGEWLQVEIDQQIKSGLLESLRKDLYPDVAQSRHFDVSIKFIYNEQFSMGMFRSLQKGIQALQDYPWIIYHFVDQPHLPMAFYQQLAEQLSPEADIVQPEVNGKSGHPLALNQRIFPIILKAPTSTNLKALSHQKAFRIKRFQCTFKEALQDIDTYEDYLKLEKNNASESQNRRI